MIQAQQSYDGGIVCSPSGLSMEPETGASPPVAEGW